MSEEDERGVWPLFDAVVKATTEDRAGHLPNCGYTDEEQVCGCAEWGTRLYAALAAVVPAPTPESGWSRLAADDGWDDVDAASLLARAVEGVAWGLLDQTMDVADREPGDDLVAEATATARKLLAALPAPVGEDAAAPAPRRLRGAIQPTRSHGAAKEDQQ